MRNQLNCPNCGAPIDGSVCNYCGTVFLDFGAIEIYKPLWLRVKLNDQLICLRVIPERLSIDTDMTKHVLYADDKAYQMSMLSGYSISVDFHSIADSNGRLALAIPEDKITVDPVDLVVFPQEV